MREVHSSGQRAAAAWSVQCLQPLALAGCLALSSALTFAAQPAAFSPAQVGKIDRLLRLVQQRLDLAPVVAETRWKTMGRIEDDASEQALVDSVKARGQQIGLDTALAARFAIAQIEAGKIIQTARHRHWAADAQQAPKRSGAGDPFKSSPSTEPELGTDMLAAMRDAAPVLRRKGGRELLDARAADLIRVGGADLLAAQAALKPLYDITR
jgi:chorismate mutase